MVNKCSLNRWTLWNNVSPVNKTHHMHTAFRVSAHIVSLVTFVPVFTFQLLSIFESPDHGPSLPHNTFTASSVYQMFFWDISCTAELYYSIFLLLCHFSLWDSKLLEGKGHYLLKFLSQFCEVLNSSLLGMCHNIEYKFTPILHVSKWQRNIGHFILIFPSFRH